MDNQYKEYSFKFVPGNRNGNPCVFAQVWLRDAMFCVIEQGHWDDYAFRFKFLGWKDMPADLARAINYAYIATFNPTRKEIGAR